MLVWREVVLLPYRFGFRVRAMSGLGSRFVRD
jgi:hypothetical protein